MYNLDIYSKFYNYLDWSNKGKATSDMGLISNAPVEAIEAYEQYKKDEIEMNKKFGDGNWD